MKSIWHSCVFVEDESNSNDKNGHTEANIAESIFRQIGGSDSHLITAVKSVDSEINNSLLITITPGAIECESTSTEDNNSLGVSSKCVKIHVSRRFIQTHSMINLFGTYLMKIINPYPLEKIILGATTDDVYKSTKEDNWTIEMTLKICGGPLLCRQGDAFPWKNKENSNIHPELIILQCQPVLQGIITVETQVVIVKLEPGKVQLPHQQIIPLTNYSMSFNLFAYWNLVQYCTCFVLPYTLKKVKSPNPVLAIIASAYRLLHQRIKPKFNIQILPVCPIRNVGCGTCDPNNTIFIRTETAKKLNIKHLSWVLIKLSDGVNQIRDQCDGDNEVVSNRKRWAQVYHIADNNLNMEIFGCLNENLVYLNPVLWFNLNNHPSPLVQPDAKLSLLKFADTEKLHIPEPASEVTVGLVQAPHCEGFKSFDPLLHKYFSIKRYLQIGDILCVGSTDDGDIEHSLIRVRNGLVFFKVTKLNGSASDIRGYLAAKQITSLFQSNTVFSYAPNTMDVYLGLQNGRSLWNTPLPAGLINYVNHIQDLVTPYLKIKSLMKQMLPSVLLTGPRGCGKMTILKAAARLMNVHIHQVECYDLLAETSGSTEGKLKQAIMMASKFVPCLMVLKNVHVIGKSKDGSQEDNRVMQVFRDFAATLIHHLDHPLILIGITTDDNLLTTEYSSIFIHKVRMKPPSLEERKETLDLLSINTSFGIDVCTSHLANNTKGFVLGDLCALITNAILAAHKRLKKLVGSNSHPFTDDDLTLSGIFLCNSDFTEALTAMHTAYSDAIGAPKVPNVEWEDVGGLEDVKREILDTIKLPLQHPELISSGLRRSGILLFGPPGTGKTLLAKAVATECHLHFLSVKGPELLNMYVGQSEENVREVFNRARNAAPCVVFFDELDSLAPNRGRSGDSGGVMDRVVSQLLAELDGLDKEATVYVIGATNRPDLIDPALLRPGRFDKLLFVGVSEDVESKLKILEALTRKFNLSEEVVLKDIASICPPTATGADLYALCSDALMNAISKRVHELSADVSEDCPLVVTKEDLVSSARNLVPSVSSDELKRYKQIKTSTFGK